MSFYLDGCAHLDAQGDSIRKKKLHPLVQLLYRENNSFYLNEVCGYNEVCILSMSKKFTCTCTYAAHLAAKMPLYGGRVECDDVWWGPDAWKLELGPMSLWVHHHVGELADRAQSGGA